MHLPLLRKAALCLLFALGSIFPAHAATGSAPTVAWQPLAAHVRRVIQALEYLGAPLPAADRQAITNLLAGTGDEAKSTALQEALDRHCLATVTINPESRVKVAAGPARPELDEKGWRVFLVKVHNEAGVTAELQAASPQARALYEGGWASSTSDKFFRKTGGERGARQPDDLWMDLETYSAQPLRKELSGLPVEYRVLQIYSRDRGQREAKLIFSIGQGSQDLGFRSEMDILFKARSARDIALTVHDENDQPTTGAFVIRDLQNRIYPALSKRLAPDFGFQSQVYRQDGEILRLPDGTYTFEFSRGPESITQTNRVVVNSRTKALTFKAERWIDPSKFGWWSGDHHIHAAGCAHYTSPTEGVHAPDMFRHCVGEDLKVGANLTWGPCFDYQKQFFTGKDDKVSIYPYLLRYDIEVSGFGSHQSGHLCLLRLKDQMFPGGESKDHWPTLCLNTLRWAKRQGAIVGPAHSGWGLEVETSDLPNYIVPPFNGIGAMEYIVDVTHEVPGPDGRLVPAVDFISTVDTPYVWELNMWYHTLNVGYRTRISGETDFPCIYGERVGLGRSYVHLEGALDYDRWCEGIRDGRNYVGDGRSHFLDFSVNGTKMGVAGSELNLDESTTVQVRATVAARLENVPTPDLSNTPYHQQPYWHLERARIPGTRSAPVEVIVNGVAVARTNIVADGAIQNLVFDVPVTKSSWIALRILPSAHTNPVFVKVGGKPIRASRQSAEWCLKSVDRCWSQKEQHIRRDELPDARAAYEHARQAYRRLVAESAE